jgi:threonylcarbamoyladenosine tRNA methylthiotransferase MtaB
VIPFARGKSRSLSISHLVEKVNEFYNQGLNEVVLTGVHIGDYESDSLENDQRKNFDDLIETLLSKTQMPRFRLSSLEPIEISDRLLEMYSDDRLCPHFHMSIQSANTKVLADMKRKYTAEHVEDSLNRIYKKLKNPFVGMDVIAGFPGETEEEFEDTYQRLSRTPWTRMHVFPYSERPGTKALKIEPKVPNHIIHARAERLRQLSSDRYSMMALDQIGTTKKVLVLKSKAKGASTLSRDYWPVDVDISDNSMLGKEVEVQILGYDQSNPSRIDGYLKGKLIEL